MPATGHAVQTFGKILVNTISDTPRAAMVNWLVTVPQVMILQRHSDDDIAARPSINSLRKKPQGRA